jgi:hypothetical protein
MNCSLRRLNTRLGLNEGLYVRRAVGKNGNTQGGYYRRNTAYGWLYDRTVHLGTIMNRERLHITIYMFRR